MIDVIMPCYNPDKELLLRAFDSLRKQTYKDFIITIVNDCGSSEFENWLPEDLNIRVLNRETNGGCGMARQTGIDNTEYEWFMFLDCDDILYPDAIESLISNSSDFTMVESIFLQEVDSRNALPIYPGKPSLWMHGKLYNTNFIKENNIHFFDKIRYNEDYGFNLLVREMSEKINPIKKVTYIWSNNNNSVTREGKLSNYAIHNAEQQVMVISYCIDFLTNKNKKIDYVNLIAVLYDVYQYSKCICDDFIDKKLIKKILSNELVIESFKEEKFYTSLNTLKQYKNNQGIEVFYTQTFIDWLVEFNAKEILNILIERQGIKE